MNVKVEKEETYELFARINRGDELSHIGTVKAASDELAVAYATFIYNEEDWADMVAVRRDHIVTVRSTTPLFKQEEVTV